MTRFYIVDQSLVNRGGHHYDYTTCIAEAAASMGFQTVILANQKLEAGVDFPNAQLRRLFKNTVYQRASYLAGLRHLKRAKGGLFDQCEKNSRSNSNWIQFKAYISHRNLQRQRLAIIRQFAKDCQTAFSNTALKESDHVFLTTVSELELMGLAMFLSATPGSIAPTWHLQFHFNLFQGRPPEYAAQSAVEKLTRDCFESTFNRLVYHRVKCYTTSQPLADQYNRLGVQKVAALPYPVAPEFAASFNARNPQTPHFENQPLTASVDKATVDEADITSTDVNRTFTAPAANELQTSTAAADRQSVPPIATSPTAFPPQQRQTKRPPLRFTCPGQIRREKGCFQYLQPLVNELWDTHLVPGKMKIAVQRPRRKKFRKQKIKLAAPQSHGDGALSTDAIEYFDHPLGRDAYIDFVKNTDCGLLFYDSRAYYSRRAGVLGELLSAGKPLIVSAGSWLARQIAEPNFQYGERIAHQSDSVRVARIEDLEYGGNNVPATAGVVSFDQVKHPFQFSFNRRSLEYLFLLSFAWKFPSEEGTFAKIEVKQKDGNGKETHNTHQIVGHRQSDRNPNCLFRLQRTTETIEVKLSNAFSSSTASIKDIQIEILTDPLVEDAANVPTSSVGIIAADANHLAAAVDEMVLHYDHYKDSAETFSRHWFATHHPNRTVARLIAE